ncbi:MAG: hypothetical protein ACO1TE_20955 [Prosthecobacter sp.]
MKPISQEAWSAVHQKACDIVNASLMEDEVLMASGQAAMLDILDALEAQFGRQTAVLATRADYVEGADARRQLLEEALVLAREQGDGFEVEEILDSLQRLKGREV